MLPLSFSTLSLVHSQTSETMFSLSGSSIASSSRLSLRVSGPRLAYTTSVRQASSRSSPTKPSLNVGSASGGPQDPLAYCSSLVQRLDPEAWLTSYFWKGRERAWYLAWRAFNVGFLISPSPLGYGKLIHGKARASPHHDNGHSACTCCYPLSVLA